MKRLILAVTLMVAAVSLQARTLIVYYSFTNHVETIVNDLQEQTGADVLRVEPAEENLDYAANNYAIGSALIAAIRNNPNDAASYPSIKTTIDNLADYDMIIVATPLWWSNMAAPMQTFLFNYGDQMAGKPIGLIVSSASSGISGVVADAKRLIPEGNFLEPNLWIRSSQTSNSHSLVASWLEDIDYANNSTAIADVLGETSRVSLSLSQEALRVTGDVDAISLYNMAGARVAHASGDRIETSALLPGVYVAAVDTRTDTKTFKVKISH